MGAQPFDDVQKGAYGKDLFYLVDSGLTRLELTILGLQESEQVARVWEWVQGMEKDNPSFVKAIGNSPPPPL